MSVDGRPSAQRQVLQTHVERIEAAGDCLQLTAGMGPVEQRHLETILHQLSHHRLVVAVPGLQSDATLPGFPNT